MLTATYSLVAIAAEQDNARGILARVRQVIHTGWHSLQHIDMGFLETAFSRLVQVDTHFQRRKIELYLIPALRNLGQESDVLLAELDALASKASALLRLIGEQLHGVFDPGRRKVDEVCHAMDGYCETLFRRLEKEDKELLPLARRVLSVEDWFSVAAQLLSDDAVAHGRKRQPFIRPRVLPAHVRMAGRALNGRQSR